jgi:branched-chain amino acid transport system substrate-binding protein
MRQLFAMAAVAASLVFATPAGAEQPTLTLGVLEDYSGLYADATGEGSTVATQMAIEDSGLAAKGWKIKVLTADHLNKPDVGVNIARKWIDEDKVDAIVGLGSSGVALAVNQLIHAKNNVALIASAGTSDLTGTACTANTIHWTYDTYALANSTGTAMTKAGGKSWFFITADYAFGLALERDTTAAVEKAGGKVLGHVRHPLSSSDFSSFLLQAQASGAEVIGFANAGSDATNSIKQAAEFGLTRSGQKIASLLMFLPDVKALGTQAGQGLSLTETFYWDLNDATRAFTARFTKRMKNGAVPSMPQAGVYGVTLHYLKTAAALNGDVRDGAKVVAKMKELPTDDRCSEKARSGPTGATRLPPICSASKLPRHRKGPGISTILSTPFPASAPSVHSTRAPVRW